MDPEILQQEDESYPVGFRGTAPVEGPCGGQSLPDAKEKYEISVQFLTFCCRNLGINEWDEYSCANSQFKKFRAFSGGGG